MTGRRVAERRGRWAERWAAIYLRVKGYRVLEHRYKSRVGEIDLICRQRRTLIFIEVKYRSTHTAAAESVTQKARRRIERAAEGYVATLGIADELSLRFDAVLIDRYFCIEHQKSAWCPDFAVTRF